MESTLFKLTGEKKHFTYIGYILIAFSLIYFMNLIAATKGIDLKEQLIPGLIALITGIFAIFHGKSKYTIELNSNHFHYKTKYTDVNLDLNDISVVKSYQEMNKNSSNIIIFKDEEKVLSLSSLFIGTENLKNLFIQFASIQNKNFAIEDDLNWLNK